jgi:hypothetical protein
MRHRAVASFAALLFLAAPPWGADTAPPAKPADALWEKAVEWARKAEELEVTPGRMDVRVVVKKKNGAVASTSDMAYRVVGSGEDAETEILSVVKDGKDITQEVKEAEAKARADEEKKKEAGGGPNKPDRKPDDDSYSLEPAYHPFSPLARARVTYARSGESQLDGKKAILFTFREGGAQERGGTEGKVWLDAGTGLPLAVEARPTKLPKHADRMDQKVRFGPGPEGLWVAQRSEVNGAGGLLWIQRSVESTFTFSQYRKGPGGA